MSSTFKLSYGVPQGSVLGPVLYTMYTMPVGSIIRSHGLSYHIYADDTQIYHSAPPHEIPSLILTMQSCIQKISSWMLSNKLKLNNDKTEVMLFNTKHVARTYDIPIDSFNVGNENIKFNEKAKNLGVYFDNMLSNCFQVSNICKQMYCELTRIGKMSSYLDKSSMMYLVSAFMFSRLDYCNSLLANLSLKNVQKIQRFQNNAARMILKKTKNEHVTPLLVQLHWLPVEARIKFKLAVLCHKVLQGKAPSYISSLISPYKPSRNLRSCGTDLINIPRVNTKTYGEKAFSYAAPHIWNSLPLYIRQTGDLDQFKSELKTHLFKLYFV